MLDVAVTPLWQRKRMVLAQIRIRGVRLSLRYAAGFTNNLSSNLS
jgi:hypothetical protein